MDGFTPYCIHILLRRDNTERDWLAWKTCELVHSTVTDRGGRVEVQRLAAATCFFPPRR